MHRPSPRGLEAWERWHVGLSEYRILKVSELGLGVGDSVPGARSEEGGAGRKGRGSGAHRAAGPDDRRGAPGG